MEHDHSGHNMPMPMPDHGSDAPMRMCSMNMLWNSDVQDVCVVFSSWHITGPMTMIFSCFIIILISMLYASLLHYIRNFDRTLAITIYTDSKSSLNPASRRESLGVGLMSEHGGGGMGGVGRRQSLIPPNQAGYAAIETGAGRMGLVKLSLGMRVVRAGLYAVSVAISFWLMLVAMTYNTFLFLSIVIGAFIGHVLYEGEIDVGSIVSPAGNKGLACH